MTCKVEAALAANVLCVSIYTKSMPVYMQAPRPHHGMVTAFSRGPWQSVQSDRRGLRIDRQASCQTMHQSEMF